MNKRPWGITLFAIVFILGGTLLAISAGTSLYNYIFKHAVYLPPENLRSILINLFSIGLNFTLGLLQVYIGIGLLKLKKRALRIAIPLCIVYLVITGLGMIRWIVWFVNYWRTAPLGGVGGLLIPLVIYSIALYYFRQPETKKYFAN